MAFGQDIFERRGSRRKDKALRKKSFRTVTDEKQNMLRAAGLSGSGTAIAEETDLIEPLRFNESAWPAGDRLAPSAADLSPALSLTRLRASLHEISFPVSVFLLAATLLIIIAAAVARSPHVAGEVTVPSYVLRPALSQWEEAILDPWQHWDGLWYLKIASQGYDFADYSVAFFPLYPLLVRIVGSALHINLPTAGMLVSLSSYLIGLIYLYKLAKMEIGERCAKLSLIYLAIFPTSFFFLAIYTEALFLALSVAAFFYARQRRWAFAGWAGLLASLTRSTGLLLFLPLLIEWLQQWRGELTLPTPPRLAFLKGTSSPRGAMTQLGRAQHISSAILKSDIAYLLLIPFGTVLYAAYNLLAFGNPLAFIEAQVHWERSFALPWDTLAMAWAYAINEANIPLVTYPDGSLIYALLYVSNVISGHAFNLIFLVIGLSLTVLAFRRLRPCYGLYALLALITPIFNPSATAPLLSVPRFVVVLFPLFLVLAGIGQNRIAHWTICGVSLATLLLFLVRFASWYWVA